MGVRKETRNFSPQLRKQKKQQLKLSHERGNEVSGSKKMLWNSWVAERLLTSQEELSFMKLLYLVNH